jgi:hypothetical protein
MSEFTPDERGSSVAIGALIGRGHTPDQARRELDVHAARTGTDRAGAATHILRTATSGNAEPEPD